MWFFNQKRADQVAQSISQLIHTLSDGRKNHGPTSPERLLREFATLLSEDTIIGTAPDHSSHRLTFDGRGVYSGFSLACFLPPRMVMIDLHPTAVGQHARLLYAACKAMPNVVERRDFRWDR
ncbi:MAG: hypothetical protein E6G75_01215 [Alphaproteobacteria bacterium]|nr:MAG: hypothetical protein E6G75_01215 [Alphaproteobacteria bacterium]